MKKYLINGFITFVVVGFFTGLKMAHDEWRDSFD